jgi:Tol biopolymer transport system component
VVTLEGVEDFIVLPLWSPDGESIAYLTDLSLRVFNMRTGEEHKVSARPAVDGLVWSPDSQRIAATVTVFGDMDSEYGESKQQVYIFDIEREMLRPLIDEP